LTNDQQIKTLISKVVSLVTNDKEASKTTGCLELALVMKEMATSKVVTNDKEASETTECQELALGLWP
jgi:hypothetical protein